jgi:hypothetical protein
MSKGDTRSQYNNHRREAELHDAPEHAHEVGALHEKVLHEKNESYEQAHETHYDGRFGHKDIEALAHQYWQARGCPEGSPDEDWSRAVKELRLRHQNVS